MKQLTKAEEEIIQVLWHLENASVKDILAQLPEPKPAYNTVSTIIRILEDKAFVAHQKQGRGYIYYPLVDKKTYTKQSLSKMINNYFDGSFQNLVSFFAKSGDMDINELEDIIKEIKNK